MCFDKELLLTFSVLNKVYEHPSIRFIRGLRDADAGDPDAVPPVPPSIGTIENPRNANIPMRSTVVDPKICSFIYNGEARFVLPKVVTDVSGHDGEDTTWSLLAAPTPPYGSWAVLARDIILQYPSRNGAPVATNPHGLAQARGFMHIIDYASTTIYTAGTDDLNGLVDYSRYTLTIKPFDVSAAAVAAGDAALPEGAKGQAIISIKAPNGKRYVFALFIVSVDDPEYPGDPEKLIYSPSVLVRLKADKYGGLTYDGQTYVGLNGVEIIPITTSAGVTYLLVPAMGGPQQKGGATNGDDSNICRILAFSNWKTDVPVIALKGNSAGTLDIRALATPDRPDDDGMLYILTANFNSLNYNGFNYTLYKTTVLQILNANDLTLLQAVDDEIIEVADSGNVISPDADNPYGIYFLDILCETGDSAKSDRLYFFIGSALLVTCAANYKRPADMSTPPSDQWGPIEGPGYVYFPLGVRDGRIGGYNIDSADLTAETLRQYHAGVALKHSAKAMRF
ncbi:MAG: hypothetical protein LBK66_05805 [Spirochaetaceae bacterium]|jgi:hypothetical protein|nr:hypothetical protein [Spirochaetaceae bacterium]